jgi:hypothetical protein
MGNSYSKPMSQWSRGEYAYANNRQDDTTVIASYLGRVTGDILGNTTTGQTLTAGATQSSIISTSSDVDAFKFSLLVSRTINVQTWERFQTVDPNLNARVRLVNSTGSTVLVTSSPTGTTRTNFTITLNPGTYFVYVDPVGEGTATTGYTSYGSMGIYNILLQFV